MELASVMQANGTTFAIIVGTLCVVSAIELAIPLHARDSRHRDHLVRNPILTFLTLALGTVLNTGLMLALAWGHARGVGILPWASLHPTV